MRTILKFLSESSPLASHTRSRSIEDFNNYHRVILLIIQLDKVTGLNMRNCILILKQQVCVIHLNVL